MTTPGPGPPPSLPALKLWTTVSLQPRADGESSNTIPQPYPSCFSHNGPLPPKTVVPYRFPCASNTTPPEGPRPPFPPGNIKSTLSLQVPPELGVNLKTTP